MKQQIRPGGSIDVATPKEMADIIAEGLDRQRNETYRREKGVINLDATGAGTGKVQVGRLYDYILERATVTAGANAIVQFYENQAANSDLLEVVGLGTAGLYSDSFSNCLFVPAGSTLVIVVSGGGANGQATYNLQVKMIRASIQS